MLAASYLCSMNNSVRLSSLQVCALPTLATPEPKNAKETYDNQQKSSTLTVTDCNTDS